MNSIWDGPPPLPDPLLVLGDISCLGIVGITLHDALQTVALEEVNNDILRGQNGDEQQQQGQQPTDEDIPNEKFTTKNAPRSERVQQPVLNPKVIKEIMNQFGQAVMRSHVEDKEAFQHNNNNDYDNNNDSNNNNKKASSNDSTMKISSTKVVAAVTAVGPSVLLRGKVNHYNRRNRKWQFLITDVELMERQQLDPIRPLRGKKKSLWDVVYEQQATALVTQQMNSTTTEKNLSDQEVKTKLVKQCAKVEILMYDESH